MESVEEMLVKALEDLVKADLKRFQWHLTSQKHMSKSEMENSDILDTVDKMVARFGPEGAVKITVEILRKMNQNNLAEQLEKQAHGRFSLIPPKRDEPHLNSDRIPPKRDEPRLNTEADKATYFDEHWSKLIQGVTNVGIIADKLCQQKIIHKEQYSKITHESLTSQERMRKICDIISKRSDAVKAELISVLQEEKLYDF